MIQNILIQAGFRNLIIASNCQEARQIFSRQTLDGAILDIMLPDGDGFSLLQELRSQKDIPVLFLSAKDQDADRLQGLGLGAGDYIYQALFTERIDFTANCRTASHLSQYAAPAAGSRRRPARRHHHPLGQQHRHHTAGTTNTDSQGICTAEKAMGKPGQYRHHR